MVATDTIVGIVGAVVLVAVMGGVFAYEYNNVPDDGGEEMPPIDHLMEEASGGSLNTQTPTATITLTPDEGVLTFHLQFDWTPTVPSTTGALAQVSYTLKDPEGTTVESRSTTTGFTFDVPDVFGGAYALTLSLPQGSLGGAYDVQATYTYPAAA